MTDPEWGAAQAAADEGSAGRGGIRAMGNWIAGGVVSLVAYACAFCIPFFLLSAVLVALLGW